MLAVSTCTRSHTVPSMPEIETYLLNPRKFFGAKYELKSRQGRYLPEDYKMYGFDFFKVVNGQIVKKQSTNSADLQNWWKCSKFYFGLSRLRHAVVFGILNRHACIMLSLGTHLVVLLKSWLWCFLCYIRW